MNEIIETYKNTVIFYEVIIASAALFACTLKWFPVKRERNKWNILTVRHGVFGFIVSFAILWFVLAFANCGTDYAAYENCFINSLNPTYWANKRIESGYVILNFIIRFFTDDFEVYHAIWAFVLLFLVYSTIFKYREYVHPGLAIFAYANIFYIQSLDLMRIYLAAALVFWGYRFLEEKKYIKYGVVIIIAMTIHTSAIVCFLPLILLIFIRHRGYIFLKIGSMIIFLAAVYVLRTSIFGNLFGYSYLANNTVSFGAAAFVYYVPLILMFVFIFRKKWAIDDGDAELTNTFFIMTLSGFAIYLMSYIVTFAGRLSCYFMLPFVFFPSYFVNYLKQYKKSQLFRGLCVVLILVFMAFRGYMLFEYLKTDSTAPYTNIFGLNI